MAATDTGTRTGTRTSTSPDEQTRQPWLWNVVLLDDDQHTYEYVIAMMQVVFGYSLEKGFRIAKAVDADGRAICCTTHKELAELKRELLVGFGADPLMTTSTGPMRVVLEPAECGGDGDDDA